MKDKWLELESKIAMVDTLARIMEDLLCYLYDGSMDVVDDAQNIAALIREKAGEAKKFIEG